MQVVAIIEKSNGNQSVGEMWKETKVFDINDSLESVMDWAMDGAIDPPLRKNLILTLPSTR